LQCGIRPCAFADPARPQADVLDGISFKVRAGEKAVIVGPSGASKSTVFHVMLLIKFLSIRFQEQGP
jgi:ABC-type multidrug transport system fused ATPase/permease subunit